jgi:hypothetical protein
MSRLAPLLLLLLCGCGIGLTPVDPSPPEPDVPVAEASIDGMAATFGELYRRTCTDAAGKLRSGAWSTDRQYLDGHRQLVRDALEAAGQPLADRQQHEATPFDAGRMADWLEAIARERP